MMTETALDQHERWARTFAARPEIVDFEEGKLPRRLSAVTMRKI